MALAEYSRKRDFKQTAEPAARHSRAGQQRYVIQKHAASRLHYDFRLELDGVLKSWAVPKGVPYLKGEKRLAVQVEDHPVAYIDFEGIIPQGQYGGGTVMVWDRGTFQTAAPAPLQELSRGKLHFSLRGVKLHGDWYLVQLRGSTQWLLIKGGENLKPVSKKADDTSALSGKTMQQLGHHGQVWKAPPKEKAAARKPKLRAQPDPVRPPSVAFIEPMQAQLKRSPPAGDDWLYEIKFDGFRALAYADRDHVRLLSRNEKPFNDRFPDIVDALAGRQLPDVILDGEIVALDDRGVSSFQLLQAYELGETRPPICFYVFDVLRVKGRDLRGESLVERKARLEKLLGAPADPIRLSAALGESAAPLLKQAQKLGLEGLIGKRKTSRYEAGQRSGAWIKLKLHREQEFVIGGYTEPAGSRSHFGALLLGFYRQKQLRYCGKVGAGLNEQLLENLARQFAGLARPGCPFANLPEPRGGRFAAGVTAAEMRRCHWLKPQLVGQIRFSEWTRDGKLRQPVFLGLRQDKAARDVVRELPT